MADRDTSGIGTGMGAGTGGPNRKVSDPMARDQNAMGQSNSQSGSQSGSQPGSQPSATGSQHSGSQHNDMGRMSNTDRNSGDRMGGDVSRMSEDATQAGRDSVSSAQGRIRSLLEQQSHRAADQLGSVANALHKAAEQLSDENNGTAARYAGQAADRVEQVADMLRNSTVDDMVGQVERFARRQPEVFVGAAFAVGFLFARFIKSSGERRFQGSGYQGQSSRMTSSRMMEQGYGHEDRDHGRSDYSRSDYGRSGTASSMGTGMGSTGTASRGMAGGIAGSTSMGPSSMGSSSIGATGSSGFADRSRQGNYATAGAAPPRASLNAATAATSAARTRDAAQLMAGGSPEPTRTNDISSAKPNQGKTGSTADVTPVTGIKPQGTLP